MSRAVLFVAVLAIFSTAVYADQFVIINGHRMMPLTSFSQDFGAVVGFDDGRNAIFVTMGNRTVELVPYSTTAWIDGNPVAVANPVVIVDDVTYVPVRFMCHAFNLNTTWSDGNQQLIIVNPYTSDQVFFQLDLTFGQRPHFFRRDYDRREYQNFPRPPLRRGPGYRPKGIGPRGGGGFYRQPQGVGPRGGGGFNRQPQGVGPRGGGFNRQPQGGGPRGGGGQRGGTGERGREGR